MAAMTLVSQKITPILSAQDGCVMVRGVAKFPTTDATGTLAVAPIRQIQVVQLTPVAGAAADEILQGPDVSSGYIDTDASGCITITRTGASKTSGLAFSYLVFGV